MKWFCALLGLFVAITVLIVLLYVHQEKINKMGLITDGYGIVSQLDLDFEKTKFCPEPFFPKKFSVCDYWQCLKVKKYFLSCENFYLEGEGELGQLTFWILSNNKKFYFSTRRNYSAQTCATIVKDISRVISNQNIVCLAGSHLPDKNEKESHWILERVKTKTDFWSMSHVWFPGEDEGEEEDN